MTAPTAVDVLRAAADAFRTGQIAWGTGWFYDPAACTRCALGAVAWAINPADEDCDPKFSGPAADRAMHALADYLITELDAAPALEVTEDPEDETAVVKVLDPVETVGGWNDAVGRTVAEVVAAMESAAERAA